MFTTTKQSAVPSDMAAITNENVINNIQVSLARAMKLTLAASYIAEDETCAEDELKFETRRFLLVEAATEVNRAEIWLNNIILEDEDVSDEIWIVLCRLQEDIFNLAGDVHLDDEVHA